MPEIKTLIQTISGIYIAYIYVQLWKNLHKMIPQFVENLSQIAQPYPVLARLYTQYREPNKGNKRMIKSINPIASILEIIIKNHTIFVTLPVLATFNTHKTKTL